MAPLDARAALALSLAAIGACHEPPPQVSGCGKDTDCKGDRICVDRSCVDPPDRPKAPSPTPPPQPPPPPAPRTDPSPEPTPAPEPTVERAPPKPAPTTQPAPDDGVRSGERGKGCGCAPDDIMCAMKCAQKGNAADPSTFPDPTPKPVPDRPRPDPNDELFHP